MNEKIYRILRDGNAVIINSELPDMKHVNLKYKGEDIQADLHMLQTIILDDKTILKVNLSEDGHHITDVKETVKFSPFIVNVYGENNSLKIDVDYVEDIIRHPVMKIIYKDNTSNVEAEVFNCVLPLSSETMQIDLPDTILENMSVLCNTMYNCASFYNKEDGGEN